MNGSELLVDIGCRTGEGPLWHPEEACLYWMDIPNGHLYRYGGGDTERVFSGPVLGAATLQRDGGIALFGIHGGVWAWKSGEVETVGDSTDEMRGTRFNDALPDAGGAVLSGSMPTSKRDSLLVRIEPDGERRTVLMGLGQSNGMAWSADERVLFHVDTRHAVVRAYAYDAGVPHSPRIAHRFDARDGVPDGMAADEEGTLWVAMWGGGCVVRIDPQTGGEVDRLRVPTPLVSSVAFGGSGLSDLYITSAGGDHRAKHGELAGSVFRAEPGVHGAPVPRSALARST